jgi:AbrB family looped-hinge helix DNA binding protein
LYFLLKNLAKNKGELNMKKTTNEFIPMEKMNMIGMIYIPKELREKISFNREKDGFKIEAQNGRAILTKITGIAIEHKPEERLVDALGRIVIPKKIRAILGFEKNDSFDFKLQGEKIIMNKHFS